MKSIIKTKKIFFLILTVLILQVTKNINADGSFTADNVLIVYRSDMADSIEVAQYYRQARNIPESNMLGLSNLTTDTYNKNMLHSNYLSQIENPVSNKILSLRNSGITIHCIVLIHGMPISVTDGNAAHDTGAPASGGGNIYSPWASIDSELTLTGRGLSGSYSVISNPYSIYDYYDWQSGAFKLKPVQSGHFNSSYNMYLVTRIQGPDKNLAKALIDRAIIGEKNGVYGKAILDRKNTSPDTRWTDTNITKAYNEIISNGYPAHLDARDAVYQNPPYNLREDTFFYWGWYDGNEPQRYRRDPNTEGVDNDLGHDVYRFMPGSIGVNIISWVEWQQHGWVGGMIRDGITGTQFPVFEPFTIGFSDPYAFSKYYLNGYNYAEASYVSMPYLSWQMVVIGDPLMKFKYAPHMDSDNDGQSNSFEITAGTDPHNPDSSFNTDLNVDNDGIITLSWQSAPNRTYTIFEKDNSDAPFSVYAEDIPADPSGTNIFIDPFVLPSLPEIPNGETNMFLDGDNDGTGEYSPYFIQIPRYYKIKIKWQGN